MPPSCNKVVIDCTGRKIVACLRNWGDVREHRLQSWNLNSVTRSVTGYWVIGCGVGTDVGTRGYVEALLSNGNVLIS